MRRPRKGHRKKRDFEKVYRDFYRRTVEEPKIIAEVEARLAHTPTLRPAPAGGLRFLSVPGAPSPAAVPLGQIHVDRANKALYVSDGTCWVLMTH